LSLKISDIADASHLHYIVHQKVTNRVTVSIKNKKWFGIQYNYILHEIFAALLPLYGTMEEACLCSLRNGFAGPLPKSHFEGKVTASYSTAELTTTISS
jgi:hypothetical protein